MKADVLMTEISLILNPDIRQFTIDTLNNAPDYFFEAPASSTGRYHPQCTFKKGGLVIHVKRAVYIINRLCDGWGIFHLDRDIVFSAIILHDIAKVSSPLVNSKMTYEDYEHHPLKAKLYYIPHPEIAPIIDRINLCIENHMGRWSPKSVIKDINKYTLLELIVYTADYLATTKDLNTPLDNKGGI